LKVQSVTRIEDHLSDLQVRIDRGASGLADQVAAELRTAIRSGRLAGGVRLPASRELARDLGTSRVELPPGHDEAATVEAALERGVAVEGVAPLRLAWPGPPALVLGFARLPEHRPTEAVRLLAEATSGR
jgi:GntR family transcriptional regulator / MocR family aminotransferase